MKSARINAYESGQIGLVVLLVMSVLLTIGIGVASDSTVEQAVTRQELESSEAFNAADETVEWALGQDLSTPLGDAPIVTNFPGDVTYNVASSQYSRSINSGESGQIILSGNGVMKITLNKPVSPVCNLGQEGTIPGIIVTLIGSGGLTRTAYGPPGCNTRSDGFDLSGTETPSSYYVEVPYDASSYSLARIKLVYNAASVTVSGVPDQLHTVTAHAKRYSGEIRAVEATKGLPALPSIFDYALFAGAGDIAVTE